MRKGQSSNRRSAMKVTGGRVQKKNNQSYTGGYYNAAMPYIVIDRQRPGKGYKHLLSNIGIHAFLDLLPEREKLLDGLNAIVLAAGDPERFGFYSPGVVGICAWPRDLWREFSLDGCEVERFWLDKLGVPCETEDGFVRCKFDEVTARGHQLLGTLLHELGHHHDLMTTRSQARVARGESYAFAYSRKYTEVIFESYQKSFG